MGARKDSFANKIRQAAKSLAPQGDIKTAELGHAAMVQTPKEHKRMLNAVCEMVKAGEMERVSRGVYRYVGKKKPAEAREVMWRLLRMRRRVSVEDLVEMAGASENYAKEWLQMLARLNVVRKFDNGIYQLINDTVEMPTDDDKAARLRLIRANKKAMNALNNASAAITIARDAITNLDKELKS